MPSITMENNVIHNNEGYGVILVKPNTGDQKRVPLDRSEDDLAKDMAGQTTEDEQQGGVLDLLLVSTSSSSSATSTSSSSAGVRPESSENNSIDSDVASISCRKWQFSRQLSRNKECCSRAVQDLMDHQIFVSIQGNQFRRNGMGDFGTFFY